MNDVSAAVGINSEIQALSAGVCIFIKQFPTELVQPASPPGPSTHLGDEDIYRVEPFLFIKESCNIQLFSKLKSIAGRRRSAYETSQSSVMSLLAVET